MKKIIYLVTFVMCLGILFILYWEVPRHSQIVRFESYNVAEHHFCNNVKAFDSIEQRIDYSLAYMDRPAQAVSLRKTRTELDSLVLLNQVLFEEVEASKIGDARRDSVVRASVSKMQLVLAKMKADQKNDDARIAQELKVDSMMVSLESDLVKQISDFDAATKEMERQDNVTRQMTKKR